MSQVIYMAICGVREEIILQKSSIKGLLWVTLHATIPHSTIFTPHTILRTRLRFQIWGNRISNLGFSFQFSIYFTWNWNFGENRWFLLLQSVLPHGLRDFNWAGAGSKEVQVCRNTLFALCRRSCTSLLQESRGGTNFVEETKLIMRSPCPVWRKWQNINLHAFLIRSRPRCQLFSDHMVRWIPLMLRILASGPLMSTWKPVQRSMIERRWNSNLELIPSQLLNTRQSAFFQCKSFGNWEITVLQ